MRFLPLLLLVACGSDGVPGGGVDAMICEPGACEQAGDGPLTADLLGEWVFQATLEAGPLPPDAGPSVVDAGPFDAGPICATTIEIRVCVWDGTTAEVMFNGERTTTTIGVPGGVVQPRLGPVAIGAVTLCGITLQEEGGLRFGFTSCACDGSYITEPASHDPSGCPSFP